MPKNAKATTTTKSEKTEKPVVSAVEAAVEEVQKSVKRTKKTEKAPVVESVAPTVVSVAPTASTSATASSSSDPVEKAKRRQVTAESFAQDFENTIKSIESEIETIRANDDKNKSKGVRFLRSMLKQMKQLRADSTRLVSKKPRRTTSTNVGNNNSGFMKPVKISTEMQKFVGLKDDQLISRVDVTKAICNYVASHNLQNEGDRRRFTPDDTLSKLLNTKAPLAYYELQKHIQPHFIK